MALFFDKFPRIPYNNNKGGLSNYQIITNITFRMQFIRGVLENTAAYYYYSIRDGDTPEILAEKVYGNPEAYWILLYANNIYDPNYDWPLAPKPFFNYLVNKYRNQAAYYLNVSANTITDQQVLAYTQDMTNANSVHHYEKQITRTIVEDNTVLQINLEVDKTNVVSTINSSMAIANTSSSGGRGSWEYYTGFGGDARALELGTSYEVFDNVAGKTVTQETKGVAVTYYDYELQLNENKRNIKVIKAAYYDQIMAEFKDLTKSNATYVRRLI